MTGFGHPVLPIDPAGRGNRALGPPSCVPRRPGPVIGPGLVPEFLAYQVERVDASYDEPAQSLRGVALPLILGFPYRDKGALLN